MIPIVLFLFAYVHLAILEEQYVIPDNINVDDILKNKRLLTNYINCILEKGKCTPDGDKLRRTIPEALQNDCGKCNENVKANVEKVVKFVSENAPEQWKAVVNKYDPDGEYRKKNKKLIDESGVKF